MNTFTPVGFVVEPDIFLCRQVRDFVVDAVQRAPKRFQARGSLGPVLVLPMFIQKMIIRTDPYQGNVEGHNNIERQLTKFLNYTVIPGYELAIIIFFPDQGGLSERAIYRVELDQTQYLTDGKT